MKFNEWMTQNKAEEFKALTSDLGMETQTDDKLIESQLEQWLSKLAGLLHTLPSEKKQKLLEKVITDIKKI